MLVFLPFLRYNGNVERGFIMLTFSPITVSDRAEFYPLIEKADRPGCEVSFANLITWMAPYGGAARFGDYLLVQCNDGYLYPTGSGDLGAVIDALREDAAAHGRKLKLYGVTQDECKTLAARYPDAFTFTLSRDAFDYLYPVSQLAWLKGKKLQSKRNHCNHFEAAYDYRTASMTAADVAACRAFCEAWYAERPDEDFTGERRAISFVFDHFDELGMVGLLLYANGELAAFTMGNRQNRRVFDVNYEKACNHVDGAYSMINREFARKIEQEYPEVELLNREDDMGLEGLRQAKLSYHPQILEKYVAVWEKD